MQALTIIDDVHETQIFKPKPKRLVKSKKHIKKRTSSINNSFLSYHWDNIVKEKTINFDNITLEEINKDFIMLNRISEEELFYNEMQHIINLSNKIKKKSCISNKELTKIGKKSKRMNTKA